MFVEYPIEKKYKKADANVDNIPIPIFLIPGILGNSGELHKLAEELDKLSESERRIFIYYDPRITHPKNNHPELTLEEHGRIIAKEMKKIIGTSTSQFLIVGYSFGCTLASIAAQHLKSKELEPTVYQIDGASPKLSADYFNSCALSSTQDILNIINYAARLSGLNTQPLNNSLLLDWSALPFDQRFSAIESKLKECNKRLLHDEAIAFKLNSFLKVAKQNLTRLINHSFKTEPKFDRLSLLMINETAEKYNNASGGWDEYTNKVSLINEPNLFTETHTALVQKTENISLIAKSVHEFFTNEITPEHVFSTDLFHMLKQFKNQPYFQEILTKTIQSVSPSNSSEDSHSDSTVDTDSEREIQMQSGSNSRSELSSDDETNLQETKELVTPPSKNEPVASVRARSKHGFFQPEPPQKASTPIPIPGGRELHKSILVNSAGNGSSSL